ncbi:MAG TPA: hypothetical protein VN864_07950 [Thermoplasmata archaeon]|nr:hypothetical protein [Thermoplasmata archaeon]
MRGELSRDHLVLGLLFVVGGSSLLWGLYLVFYIAATSPSGIFNTILGLLVLLITWGFLLPYAIPAERAEPSAPPPTAVAASPPPAARYVERRAPARPTPRPQPRASLAPTPAPRIAPTSFARSSARAGSVSSRVAPVPISPPTRRLAPTPEQRRASAEEAEIAAILADLPGPVDSLSSSSSPEEMIRRLDALRDDLAGGSG